MSDQVKLQRHVERIGSYHPWYSKLLEQLGIEPAAAKLSELPLLTAPILEKHYYTQEERIQPGLSVYRTSGTSTGVRKAIYYSEEEDVSYIASKASSFREWLEKDTVPVRKALADMGTGHAASTALTIFAKLGMQADSLSFSLPIEQHIEKLESYRPELLYTMPSILDAIAAASPDPKAYGIRKIIVVGELATPQWQANIAERFGIKATDILDTYGSIEIGAIASYSHSLGLYVISEDIYAEAVPAEQIDPQLAPLAEHEGVLVLTSFVRSLFPAVRFVTYDVVRDFQTVEIDGRRRQCFSCLAKRIGSELKHGEKISVYDIESVVHQFVKDAELRVRLRDNRLSVHIRSGTLDESMLPRIQDAIEHKIADIGMMIKNRMLAGITVTRAAENEQLERGTVKAKKLYY
ncbi:AMP-binding enzyme [compost metagenome]